MRYLTKEFHYSISTIIVVHFLIWQTKEKKHISIETRDTFANQY